MNEANPPEPETPEQNFDDIPECSEARLAHDLALIPFFGFPFYVMFSFIALYRIGAVGMTGFYWLRKGFWRMCLSTLLSLALIALFWSLTVRSEMDSRIQITRANLETLRAAVQNFYERTGNYPDGQLLELYTIQFTQDGRIFRFLDDIPPELISVNDRRPGVRNPPNRRVHNKLGTEGGWYYDPQTGTVRVNFDQTLEGQRKWGQHAGENPSKW